jgi:hypothetical protein
MVLAVLMSLGAASGCRRGVPVVDASAPPPTTDGTISGRVTTAGDASRLVGRKVEAINLTTGAKAGTTTSSMGGFSLKVPPGKYRLTVELRDGEALARPPGTIDINPSDLDHDVEVVVTPAIARPRQSDVMRSSDGLGAPIA